MNCPVCRELLESGSSEFRCPKCGKTYLLYNSRFYEGEPDVNNRGEFVFSAEGSRSIKLSIEEWAALINSEVNLKKEGLYDKVFGL